MTRNRFNSYSHGDVGTEPNTSLNFQSNERPKSEQFDWWWTTVIDSINGHADEFDRLDSNDDGKVDAAESADSAAQADTADKVKGNDIDSDGDGKVNAAESADTATSADSATTAGTADEAISFQARTNYPTSPAAGEVVFRTDKT